MSFSRPFQWYLFHADPIWPDGSGTFEPGESVMAVELNLLCDRGYTVLCIHATFY